MMNKKVKETSIRPEEIYLQILLRVEARSTYACKCVCRTWLNLISDQSFIKKHLNLTLQKNKAYLMLRSQDEVSAIHTISHDSEFDDEDDAVEVDYPFSNGRSHDGVSLLGSCNGLVALCYAKMDQDHEPREIIRIWNPVTREIKLLPQSPHGEIYDEEQIVICAFGYDYKIDDYKMAKVVEAIEDEDIEDEGTSLDIYTLGTDSWKSIHQPIPYKFSYNRVPGVLVDGNFHWLAETCGENVSKVVVSFNISDENFEAIHLPNESLESDHFLRSVGLLEGCLCVLANAVDVGIEIWMMQEYGVQESWEKRYVISQELFLNVKKTCLDFLNDYKHFIRLVLSIRNGEILFSTSGMLLIYNPERGTLRESNISIPMHWCENDNYFQSLVPIGSDNYYIEGLTKDAEDRDDEDGDDEDGDGDEDDNEDDNEAEDADDDKDEDEDEEEEDDIEEKEDKEAADISCPQCGTGFGGFQCNGTTAHLQCHVCGGMMPSRTNTSVPQQCLGCDRAYCGAYWLSQGVPTSNSHTVCSPETFKPISEYTISEMPALTHENNRFEKDITERCIRQSGRTLQDVISEWIATFNSRNIDRSRLQLNHAEMITAGTHLCKDCYDKLVSFLLYWYRVTALKHTLPPDASTREDCWYGYSCRTQHHSEDHARKRNHVCRPTRGSHFVRTT